MTETHPNHKWWTLFAMCFALFMIMLDNTIVNVALPSIQRELNATPASLEWTINAYVLSFAALILLGGKLGDRFGRKRMFIVGLVLFTLFSAACALAQTDNQLIIARALQGTGAALMNPLSLSIIVSAFPRQMVATAIGIWAGVSGLGLAVGPVLGGFLVEHSGWSAVFWVNVPIGIIATAVCLWAVVESSDPTTTTLDVPGTILITAGLFALTWGLVKTNEHAWLSAYTLSFLGGAAALLAAWLFWELRTAQPMVPLGFFRKRVFSSANVVAVLVGFSLFGSIYFVTLFFQNIQHYSAIEAGVRSLPMTMMILFVAPVAGKLNARFGSRAPMTAGMIMASIGLVGLAQLEVSSSYNAIWPFYVLLGAGLATTMPAMSNAAMGAVDPRKSGVASGVLNSARQVGGAMGIAVLGSVAAHQAASHWQSSIGALPADAHAKAEQLTPLVVGGQTAMVEHLSGSPAAAAAAGVAFVEGLTAAMWIGAGLTAVAAVVSFVGLRGMVRQTPPADAPPVVVEV
jgi:EmrB/QacA subfamily drug resistance transporter